MVIDKVYYMGLRDNSECGFSFRSKEYIWI